jgi:hypothetical protein
MESLFLVLSGEVEMQGTMDEMISEQNMLKIYERPVEVKTTPCPC